MSIRFLCDAHRKQLLRSKLVAENRWDEWMEAGREAYAERNWVAALRYLGCSFELSELLLGVERLPDAPSLDRYMLAGHYLAECFARCGDRHLQRHCLLAVHYRLLKTLQSPEGRGLSLQRNVEISLQMLERHYRAENRLDELSHCRRESLRLLQRCYH